MGRFPSIQLVQNAVDLENIIFVDEMAEIEVPIEALDNLPLKNDERCDSERLRMLEETIRTQGYNNFHPIIVRLGRRGRWVIVDGGHRVTAARHVAKEILPNLFGNKVKSLYFLLYKTPLSNSRLEAEVERIDSLDEYNERHITK